MHIYIKKQIKNKLNHIFIKRTNNMNNYTLSFRSKSINDAYVE